MTVQEIYEWVNFLSNKYQSGEITDDNFNTALAFVNLELFRYETGMPEAYQVGMPVPPVAWQITNTISDDLRNFILKVQIPKDSNGYFPFPADYAVFSSMYYDYILNAEDCGGQPTLEKNWIEPVSDGELRLRLYSAIKQPTAYYPICAWYSYGFKVYPESVTQIELTYLKVPRTPVRNFTQLPNDQTQYNPIGSVQLEYPESLHANFAVRIAKYYGWNIRDEELYGWSQQRKNEGN